MNGIFRVPLYVPGNLRAPPPTPLPTDVQHDVSRKGGIVYVNSRDTDSWISTSMPGIVQVKVVSARDLPIMDRSSELTDAFVEVKL